MKKVFVDSFELLSCVSEGDIWAFEYLFDKYSGFVNKFSFRVLRSEELSEEIVQEVFLKIWERREKLVDVKNFDAYLNRMVRNAVYDALRSRVAKQAIAESDPALSKEALYPEETYDKAAFDGLLMNAMQLLTAQQQRVFSLCFLEGKKYQEAAECLNVSHGTIHAHMKAALKTVRLYIGRNSDCFSIYFIVFVCFCVVFF